jgi:hypothetical protein
MNVVPFTPPAAQGLRSWNAHELEILVSVYARHATRGDASGWEVGATEFDDPQFYVIGPAPDLDCIVVVSRIGRIYVLENGSGQVLHETSSLEKVAARAKMPLSRRWPAALVARITLGLAALRLAVEERIEPIIGESEEILLRLAPQLAALV